MKTSQRGTPSRLRAGLRRLAVAAALTLLAGAPATGVIDVSGSVPPASAVAAGPITNDYPYSGATGGVDPWNFYKGQCTSFAAWRINSRLGVSFTNQFGGQTFGNANHWDDAARAAGLTVSSTPAPGAIAQTDAGTYGHVAWVARVNSNDTVTIEEYNWGTPYTYGVRTVPRSSFQYIYFGDVGQDQAPPTLPASDSSRMRADFTGDGLDDVGLFYDYGGGHVALWVLRGMAGGGLAGPVLWWDGTNFGSNTRYVSAGDFNGDGRADIALFYQYATPGHVALFTLTSTGSAFAGPVNRWDNTNWGTNTAFMTAGDFNGDGRSDIALFYDYADSRVAIWTLLADGSDSDGRGFAPPVDRWDNTNFGSATRFVGAGDFNGDGRSDIALFYDYSDQSAAVFTLTSTGTGLAAPVLRWKGSAWGDNTAFMSVGKFANGDNRADIALLYDYGAGHVRLFTFAASTSGTGALAGPVARWDGTNWGSGTMFMTATQISSTSYDDIQLFYQYSGGPHVAIWSINPASGAYATVTRRWDNTNFGSGTRAML